MEFTHLDSEGRISMVNVGNKSIVKRQALAEAKIFLLPTTIQMIQDHKIKKGEVLACARIAGIMATKKCAELIPLCHNIFIDKVSVDFIINTDHITIHAEAFCTGKTGIEMEVLTAVNIAALTIWDMCKAVDKNMYISGVRLLNKSKNEEVSDE